MVLSLWSHRELHGRQVCVHLSRNVSHLYVCQCPLSLFADHTLLAGALKSSSSNEMAKQYAELVLSVCVHHAYVRVSGDERTSSVVALQEPCIF